MADPLNSGGHPSSEGTATMVGLLVGAAVVAGRGTVGAREGLAVTCCLRSSTWDLRLDLKTKNEPERN